MRNSLMARLMSAILVLSTAMLGMPAAAVAAPISTQTMLQLQERQARIDQVQQQLMREDVQQSLIALGVTPADAQQRIAALSDEELSSLEQQLARLPAGGDVLAVIGIVFIILIILDLVGVTNVFAGISKITR